MGWLWLGLLIGLLVGAGAVALVVRSVGRVLRTDGRSVGRLLLDGLLPGQRTGGVAAQRALARRVRRAGERTASGKRVAAETLTVHVSPEDHATIAAELGIDAAEADLAQYYRGVARSGRWLVGRDPAVTIERDISLRPRQVFVRSTTRAAEAAPPGDRAAAVREPSSPASARPERVGATTEPEDDAPTDVLPWEPVVPDATQTAVLPAGLLLGDLIVVHGTDVRTVTPAEGQLRIGRAPHNDLVLDRPGVGRDHVVVEARGDAWWIVPGATTRVDGGLIDGPTPVRSGSTMELGRGVRLRLSVGDA